MNGKVLSAEYVSAVAAPVAKELLASFLERVDWDPDAQARMIPNEMKARFYRQVLQTLMEGLDRETTPPRPEDVALTLLRQGVPAKEIQASHKHLDVYLPNSVYRIFRMNDFGSFRMMRPASCGTVRTALGAQTMADFLLAFEALVPMLEKQIEAVLGEMLTAVREKKAELKAREIERKTVQIQLDEVLPDLGVNCHYEVNDGVVHLDLTRTLTASLDIPLTELQDLLRDPERILSALSVQKARPCNQDTAPFRFRRY